MATTVTHPPGHIPVDRLKCRGYLRSMTDISDTLDAVGLLCPLPVLKARKRLKALPDGAILQVFADDPAAIVDIPHFCHEAGHSLAAQSDDGARQVYLICKGGAA